MREAGEPSGCPVCGQAARRDYRAELPAVASFNSYESSAAGVPRCVMQHARRVRRDWYVPDASQPGGRRRINPPGFDLNPKTGNVRIRNRAQKRALLKNRGLTDYGA